MKLFWCFRRSNLCWHWGSVIPGMTDHATLDILMFFPLSMSEKYIQCLKSKFFFNWILPDEFLQGNPPWKVSCSKIKIKINSKYLWENKDIFYLHQLIFPPKFHFLNLIPPHKLTFLSHYHGLKQNLVWQKNSNWILKKSNLTDFSCFGVFQFSAQPAYFNVWGYINCI